MKITTILFDAGFTLIRIHPSLGEVYARAARDLGSPFPADRFQEIGLRIWNEVTLPQYRTDLRSSDEIEHRFWWDYNQIIIGELRKEGLDVPFEPWFERLLKDFARPETWAPLTGVEETLQALADRGFALGVVSNWDSRLPGVLDGLGLGRHFRMVLTSSEAGYRKPSPHIFQKALEIMDVRPGECLHVGDSVQDDVVGARASGILAVHLRHGKIGQKAPFGATVPEAAHVIASLPELLGILDGSPG